LDALEEAIEIKNQAAALRVAWLNPDSANGQRMSFLTLRAMPRKTLQPWFALYIDQCLTKRCHRWKSISIFRMDGRRHIPLREPSTRPVSLAQISVHLSYRATSRFARRRSANAEQIWPAVQLPWLPTPKSVAAAVRQPPHRNHGARFVRANCRAYRCALI